MSAATGTANRPLADIKRALIEEIRITSGDTSSMRVDAAASSIRTTAVLDLQCSVGSLPLGIWNFYQDLQSKKPDVFIAVDEVVKAINAA